MKTKAGKFFSFIKQLFAEFSNDNVTKYAASLAYYTIFSLAPMLVIIIAVCSVVFGREAMEGQVYEQIKNLTGNEAALQIQNTIKNIHLSNDNFFAGVISVVILILGATGIFGEIQDSINKIWGLKIKTKRGWWKIILNRIISFSLVLSLGFILMVSLTLNALIAAISAQLNNSFPSIGATAIMIFNNTLSFSVTALLFAVIFKVLPDARIKWKDVWIGAFITSLLFMIGKFAIGYYLGQSSFSNVYGAAGSIVIIMLWTFYSSIILYLGAEFTKVYVIYNGRRILPNRYSVWIKMEEQEVKTTALKDTSVKQS